MLEPLYAAVQKLNNSKVEEELQPPPRVEPAIQKPTTSNTMPHTPPTIIKPQTVNRAANLTHNAAANKFFKKETSKPDSERDLKIAKTKTFNDQVSIASEAQVLPLIANTESIRLKEMNGQVDYLKQIGEHNFLVGSTAGQVCIFNTFTHDLVK